MSGRQHERFVHGDVIQGINMLMQKIESGVTTAKAPSLSGADWSVQTREIISHVAVTSATKLGLTGLQTGSGVSTLASELAQSYASIGKTVMLVVFDAASVKVFNLPVGGGAWLPRPDLESHFDAGSKGNQPTVSRAQIEAGYAALETHADMVIADLPCVGVGTTFLAAAGACNLVYMVCVTGHVSASELQESVKICKIGAVPVAGIILNDYKDISSNLFGGRSL